MRRPTTRLAALLICSGVWLWGGCGDDDGSTDNNNNDNTVVQNDAGVDAGPDAATGESLELIVVDNTDADADPADQPRLEGVTVAVDLPGGTRVEETTDAQGRVTIHGFDWSLGEAAITLYKDGFQIQSLVSLGATSMDPAENPYVWTLEGVPVWFMQPFAPDPDSLTVSGAASGLTDPAHQYLAEVVTHSVASSWEGAASSSYEIDGPVDTPFSIVGVEFDGAETLPSGNGRTRNVYRAMEVAVAATAGPTTTVNLDFVANEIPIYTADASYVFPSRVDSPIRDGVPYIIAFDRNGRYGVSWPTPMDISADGNRVEGQVSWVEPASFTEPHTQWTIYHQASGAVSARIVPGYPGDAIPTAPLYDVPRFITPADPLVYHPLHDPLEWELFDDCPAVALTIQRSGLTVWTVRAPPNATTLTVPQPPSTVDVNSFLGTNFLAFLVSGYIQPQATLADTYTESAFIRLQRQ